MIEFTLRGYILKEEDVLAPQKGGQLLKKTMKFEEG